MSKMLLLNTALRRAVFMIFDRRLTDDELRTLHELLAGRIEYVSSAPKGSSCPCCGSDLTDVQGWELSELSFSRGVLALIEEVEALRRGVAITHAVDPLPELKQRVGTRDMLDACEKAIRARTPDSGGGVRSAGFPHGDTRLDYLK